MFSSMELQRKMHLFQTGRAHKTLRMATDHGAAYYDNQVCANHYGLGVCWTNVARLSQVRATVCWCTTLNGSIP